MTIIEHLDYAVGNMRAARRSLIDARGHVDAVSDTGTLHFDDVNKMVRTLDDWIHAFGKRLDEQRAKEAKKTC